MGGHGSTRWRNHTPAPLVEESLRIDLLSPELRSALSQPGEAVATTNFAVRGRLHSQWLLHFSPASDDGSRELALIAADHVSDKAVLHFRLKPVGVGFHERIHAVCPGCEKTTRMLFALPDKRQFGCKTCTGLQYRSVREHDKRLDRIAKRLRAGDLSVVDKYSMRGRRPGHSGFCNDRLLLSGLLKAFSEHDLS